MSSKSTSSCGHTPRDVRSRLRSPNTSSPLKSRPAVGHEQPGEHIYGRGLAGAVMPQQSEDIALLYCKVEVFHCLLASETFVEVSNAEKISNRFPE